MRYTRARGLRFRRLQSIRDYDLKPVRQIFPIDSNVNLSFDNHFLYKVFWQLQVENEEIDRCLTLLTRGFPLIHVGVPFSSVL